jgi:hypothetical protein
MERIMSDDAERADPEVQNIVEFFRLYLRSDLRGAVSGDELAVCARDIRTRIAQGSDDASLMRCIGLFMKHRLQMHYDEAASRSIVAATRQLLLKQPASSGA